ncbi:MAG TPA: hypothetical protein DD381_11415 [Lentisphaeria bacterium]|nr:MAG: hypothetical protein A2X47_12700 [Lentisphaerae bacterium GWF2_38_69]HBM16938.1 hypothetical protein [Lentisphaeria bacterium]
MDSGKKNTALGILRKDLQLIRSDDPYSGKLFWMIFDPVNDKYYKINELDKEIISALNRSFTLEEYISYLKEVINLDVSQEKLLSVISFLRNNGLMLPEYRLDEKRIEGLRNLRKRTWFDRLLNAYLFFKIPVWYPDDFLNRTIKKVNFIFNIWTIWIIVFIAVIGYLQVLINWNRFISEVISTFNINGAIRYIFVIAAVKILHELAHCYAAKYLGSRVRCVGIGIIFLMPRLYTDITDSWRITNPKKRAVIDSAGILVELMIGGIAAYIWAKIPPGLLNSLAYYLCTVSIINTLFINGNPFIRFDGYYLLSDLVGVENLMKKTVDAWDKIFEFLFLGIKFSRKKLKAIAGNKYALIIIYGLFTFVYRIFLYTGFVLIVYYMFFKALGILLAIAEIHLLFYRPLKGLILKLRSAKKIRKGKTSRTALAVFIIIFILIIAPLPWNTSIPCISVSTQKEYLYMHQDGFFVNSIDDSATVAKDQTIAQFYNPYIQWELNRQKLQLEMAKVTLDQIYSDPTKLELTRIYEERKRRTESTIKDLEKQIASLCFKADFPGKFIMSDKNLQQGKWYRKGDFFGEVADPEKPEILAYASESAAKDISVGDSVTIHLGNDIKSYYGTVSYIDNVPASLLKQSPLLDAFGGPIETIPQENNLFKLKDRCYEITICVDTKIPLEKTGLVNIRIYKSMAYYLFKNILAPLQKELSF